MTGYVVGDERQNCLDVYAKPLPQFRQRIFTGIENDETTLASAESLTQRFAPEFTVGKKSACHEPPATGDVFLESDDSADTARLCYLQHATFYISPIANNFEDVVQSVAGGNSSFQ
jgi:hypothetical protein